MSIVNRESEFFKSLDTYKATAFAEGFCEGENATQFEQLCAWQFLVDTGICWKLQGFFGRTAKLLINEGMIERKKEEEVKID